MNIEHLTPQMWNLIRTWEYETLMKVSDMLQPVDEDNDY